MRLEGGKIQRNMSTKQNGGELKQILKSVSWQKEPGQNQLTFLVFTSKFQDKSNVPIMIFITFKQKLAWKNLMNKRIRNPKLELNLSFCKNFVSGGSLRTSEL